MLAPHIRLQYNAYQLQCMYGCNQWFKTAGGRTKHNRRVHEQLVSHTHHDVLDNPLIDDDTLTNDDPHSINDNPPIDDDPFIDDDPLINNDPLSLFNDNPFEDLPERNEFPLRDEIIIHHHPLINGA